MGKCSVCGAPLLDWSGFCGKCGAAANKEKNVCPHCRKETKDGSFFCEHCGGRLAAVPAPPDVPTSDGRELKISMKTALPFAGVTYAVYINGKEAGSLSNGEHGHGQIPHGHGTA